MHIGSKNPKLVYYIIDTVLSAVDTIKDLGVHISNYLSWSVNIVVKKANRVGYAKLFCTPL